MWCLILVKKKKSGVGWKLFVQLAKILFPALSCSLIPVIVLQSLLSFRLSWFLSVGLGFAQKARKNKEAPRTDNQKKERCSEYDIYYISKCPSLNSFQLTSCSEHFFEVLPLHFLVHCSVKHKVQMNLKGQPISRNAAAPFRIFLAPTIYFWWIAAKEALVNLCFFLQDIWRKHALWYTWSEEIWPGPCTVHQGLPRKVVSCRNRDALGGAWVWLDR